jgi:hypothetical protein
VWCSTLPPALPLLPMQMAWRIYRDVLCEASDARRPVVDPPNHCAVKVLYTFDDQNKSNCLARLPNVVSVPTVSLDETTQVGVIELKTCIQAIVAAR